MQLTFCILVLYISILLNSPIVSNDLSVDSLGVSILLFTNNTSITINMYLDGQSQATKIYRYAGIFFSTDVELFHTCFYIFLKDVLV